MPSGVNILVVESGEALPANLQPLLQSRGYSAAVVSRLEGVLAEWSRFDRPILIVDCCLAPLLAEKLLGTLVERRDVLRCPIIGVADDPRRASALLSRYFAIAPVLGARCGGDDIVRLLSSVERAYERIADRANLVRRPASAGDAAAARESAVIDVGGNPYISVSCSKHAGAIYFAEAERLGLSNAELQGDDLIRTIEFDELKALGFAPADPRSLEAAHAILEGSGRLGRRQVLRTARLVGRLVRALKLPERVYDTAATAALLYGWAFAADEPELLRRQYLSRRGRAIRRELSQGIIASGERVRRELQMIEAAAVIDCFGKLVGGASIDGRSPETVEAATILFGAELVGRICFQSGFWNPRHAYRVLQRLEAGLVEEIPPAVTCGLVRLVAAAVTEKPRGFVVPRRLRRDAQLLQRAREHREGVLAENEARVSLADIAPGMRLARPIETFDGTTVLEDQAVLDHDIIWRLWRLAAIRPLNAPVVVGAAADAAPGASTEDSAILRSEQL